MKITAMDIHRKEFGHAVRGYREDEVDNFLDAIAHEIDRLHSQIGAMEARAREAEAKSLNLEAERNTINNALLTAQRASDDVLEQAQARGKELLEEAEQTAKEIIGSAREDKQKITTEIKRLKAAEEKYRERYLTHLQESIAAVKEIKLPGSVDLSEDFAPRSDETQSPEEELVEAASEVSSEEKIDNASEVAAESSAAKTSRVAPRPFEPIPDPNPSYKAASEKQETFAPAAQPAYEPAFAADEEEGYGQWGEMEDLDDDLELIS